jgi:hypothetical protein
MPDAARLQARLGALAQIEVGPYVAADGAARVEGGD